jgi:regulator of cell morphogenesis and NO signaling
MRRHEMSAITESTIVAEVVLDHPETTGVFDAHGIDFCCGGRQSIAAACARRNQDARKVIDDLEDAIDRAEPDWKSRDPRRLSTAALIARIIDEHHNYLRESLPETARLMEKVAEVHGPRDARLAELRRVVLNLVEIVTKHLTTRRASSFRSS